MAPDTAAALEALLEEGRLAGLYSGAAAGVWTEDDRVLVYSGTHAFGVDRAVDAESLFDLASVSKTFTAAVLLRLAESGLIALDEPIRPVLPVGTGPGADVITPRMLLTHTSGLPAESFLWRDSPGLAPEDRLAAVLATRLETAPDAEHRYSCVGYVAAGAFAERITGSPLEELLDELVLQPLELASVGFSPVDPGRAVATEEEPWVSRGLVRGEVHDELNWYLGGRVGNSGLFGTAEDVLTFAASFDGAGLLGPDALRLATTDQLQPRHGAAYGQAMGARVGDRDLFGDTGAVGHAGYTGTLWLAIPDRHIAAVLLTNRVHPHRDRVDLGPFRRRFSAWVAGR